MYLERDMKNVLETASDGYLYGSKMVFSFAYYVFSNFLQWLYLLLL